MATIHLDDTFGDAHALTDPNDAAGATIVDDEQEIREALYRLLAEPGPQADQLRRMAYEDPLFEQPLHPTADVSDAAIVDTLTDAALQGRVALTRQRVLGGGASAPRTEDEETINEDANVPCDFEYMIVKCAHMPDSEKKAGRRELTQVRFWKEAGSKENDLPTPRPERAHTREIEVVAGFEEKDADEITIKVEGGPGYGCGRNHPHVKVTKGGEVVVEKQGETEVKFKALCPDPRPAGSGNEPLDAFLRRFYLGNPRQHVYTVDVAACGRWPDNAHQHGRRQEKIRVYPKELYKLELTIPGLAPSISHKRGAGRHLQTGEDGSSHGAHRETTRGDTTIGREEVVRRDTDGNVVGRSSTDTVKVSDTSGTLVEQTARSIDADSITNAVTLEEKAPMQTTPAQVAASLTLKRDGTPLPMDGQIGKLINQLVNLKRSIDGIMNFIKDFQPQVGWKFVVKVDLFSGSLAFEWAHREWTDHTIYSYWKLTGALTLVNINLDVSFGIGLSTWWATVEVAVYGQLGINASVELDAESTPDQMEWSYPVPKAAVTGELGVRAVLGDEWARARGAITAGLDFEAECKIDGKPFRIEWQIHRKKVEVVVEARAWPFGTFDKKWEWAPEVKGWKRGVFPSGDSQQRPTPGSDRINRATLTPGQRRKLARTGRL